MKLRTFDANDMQQAMKMVRETMGDSAIIISTKQVDTLGAVQVTAAFEPVDVDYDDNYDDWFATLSGVVSNNIPHNNLHSNNSYVDNSVELNNPNKLSTKNMPRHSLEPKSLEHNILGHNILGHKNLELQNISLKTAKSIENILVEHGVNQSMVEYLCDKMSKLNGGDAERFSHHKNTIKQWFGALIEASFVFSQLNVGDDCLRYILIGAQGAGKTLSVAKIAADCVKNGQIVHVITVDNNKAGGAEQLSAITDILGINLLIARSRNELRTMLSDIPLNETVLVDSAGANPYDFGKLKELAEYANMIELEPVLVYAAGADPAEADEIARAFSFIGVEKIIITRIDCARRFGSILNAAGATHLKIVNITGTENIIGAFEPCNAEIITKLFFSSHSIAPEPKIEGLLP